MVNAVREYDPFSYAFQEDPYPTFRWLRDEEPLYHNERLEFWALSRYQDVVDASRDWQTFSSAGGTTLEPYGPRQKNPLPHIVFMDPSRHTWLRAVVSKVFTAARVASLEPFIRECAIRRLTPLAEAGGGDFVQDFSSLLPMDVIFTMLGVPDADRHPVRRLMDQALHRDPGSSSIPPSAEAAARKLIEYWYRLIAERRAKPSNDLLSDLLVAEVQTEEDARPLTDLEVVGFLTLLAIAGNETVTRLLASAVVAFQHHPHEYRKVLQDPARIPAAVEEIVRHAAPSQYQGRTLTRDLTLHGKTAPRGARILLVTAAATRDDRVYEDPDRFDIDRQQLLPLGFGHGPHFCLGTPLARLESRVALEEFSRRFPRYHADESRAVYSRMSQVRGFSSLPFQSA